MPCSAESLLERNATTASEHEKALVLAWGQALNDGRAADAHAAAVALGAVFPDHPVGALWDLYASLFGGADSVSGAAPYWSSRRLSPAPRPQTTSRAISIISRCA